MTGVLEVQSQIHLRRNIVAVKILWTGQHSCCEQQRGSHNQGKRVMSGREARNHSTWKIQLARASDIIFIEDSLTDSWKYVETLSNLEFMYKKHTFYIHMIVVQSLSFSRILTDSYGTSALRLGNIENISMVRLCLFVSPWSVTQVLKFHNL